MTAAEIGCVSVDGFIAHAEKRVGGIKPAVKKWLSLLICAMAERGCDGKTEGLAEECGCHRTAITKFLSKTKIDLFRDMLRSEAWAEALEASKKLGLPIFASLDDTTCPKHRPDGGAKNPIEGCGNHYSHLLGRHTYGHQVVAVILSVGPKAWAYDVEIYDNGKDAGAVRSKIDISIDMIMSIPNFGDAKVYFLADSWYTSKKIVNACKAKGYVYIGALKNNRKAYASSGKKGDQIADFAMEVLNKDDFIKVKTNGSEYFTYRYDCGINGVKDVVVIITVPVGAFGSHGEIVRKKLINCFMCTDQSLSVNEILYIYTKRWTIEIFFKQVKSIGFGKQQIRSKSSIEKLWLIMGLSYSFYAEIGEGFEASRKLLRTEMHNNLDNYHYNRGRQDADPLHRGLMAS
jgi:hypothetical protein